MNDEKENLEYSVKELAEILKVSKSNVYQLVKDESFPKRREGKRIFIPIDDFKKWIRRNCNGE